MANVRRMKKRKRSFLREIEGEKKNSFLLFSAFIFVVGTRVIETIFSTEGRSNSIPLTRN